MFSKKKPYTAVTVQIDNLTSDRYEVEDSSGITDLIEAVRIQKTGPREATRAIRKKLKYGQTHQQLRALTILDLLIQNAGREFLQNLSDYPLVSRLQECATDNMSDRRVRHKCRVLFPQWEVTARTVHEMQCFILLSRETASHYKRVAEREALQAKHARKSHRSSSNSQSLTHSEENQPDGGAFGVYTGRSTHSSGDKRRSRGSHHSSTRSFDFKKEEKNIRESIASSNIASDNLMNALRLVNNQSQNVSENSDVSRRFKECKSLRRQMVRYIQNVTSEQYLGSLLKANENLVQAMENYDLMNKSADYSTDSEDGEYISSSAAPSSPPPARPPRPDHAAKPQFVNPPESESDEDDNPFGDRHAVHSPPSLDREGHSWTR